MLLQWKEETMDYKMDTAAVPAERMALLKSYLQRLSGGEDLETVREDFVKNFSDVEPSEIMKAEQTLMQEGTPLTDVQRLCDVHSALFHGATREERIANAESAVAASAARQSNDTGTAYADKFAKSSALTVIYGHPLNLFAKENEALDQLMDELRAAMENQAVTDELLSRIREIAVHYAKKGDLLYPHLKVKYGVSGPADVMWTVDDEIRDELGSLAKEYARSDAWYDRLAKVLVRMEEMIYKEKNILFPICAVNFTKDEWYRIYRDSRDYSEVFRVPFRIWQEAEAALGAEDDPVQEVLPEGEIRMPGGHMSVPELTALLNTIPLEISFIDAGNINRYFNEGPKVFKRPGMAIDREVFSCHPPKIAPMVRSILDSFRDGTRDSVPVWMEKNGRTMLVTYMAVRDRDGNYLGATELVQNMEAVREHFQKAKPVDPKSLY